MISELLRRPKQLAALFKQAEELWRAAKGARVSRDEALLALLFLRGGSSLARLKATIVALSGEFLQDEGRMFLQAGVLLLEDFEEVVTGAGVEGFEARSRRV